MHDLDAIIKKTIQDVLNHPKKERYLNIWSKQSGVQKTDADLKAAAKEYLPLIAPKPKKIAFKFANTFLKPLTHRNYEKYIVEGSEQLEKIKGKTIIFVPNHLNHADHFPIGFALYDAGFNMEEEQYPSMVAGNNLYEKLIVVPERTLLKVGKKHFEFEWKRKARIIHKKNKVVEWLMRTYNANILHREFITKDKSVKDHIEYSLITEVFRQNMLEAHHPFLIYAQGGRYRPGSKGEIIPQALKYAIDAGKSSETYAQVIVVQYETPPDLPQLINGKRKAASFNALQEIIHSIQKNRWGEVHVKFCEPIKVEDMTDLELAKKTTQEIWSSSIFYPLDMYCYAKTHYDNVFEGIAQLKKELPLENQSAFVKSSSVEEIVDRAHLQSQYWTERKISITIPIIKKEWYLPWPRKPILMEDIIPYFSQKSELALKYIKEKINNS